MPILEMWSWWFLITILTLFCFLRHAKNAKNPNPPLPPGPRGVPVLGYLPFLGTHMHRAFKELSLTYGPIYKLWLGNKLCIVISSPSLLKQVLRDHDAVFANRDPPIAGSIITYGSSDVVFSSYGSDWRKLRKVFASQMLSSSSLDSCFELRRKEVEKAVRSVSGRGGEEVDVGELAFVTVMNVVASMVVGGNGGRESRDGSDPSLSASKITSEFREAVREVMVLMAKPNVSDLWPILARFDVQGVERRVRKAMKSCEELLDSIIQQREGSTEKEQNLGGQNENFGTKKKDFLQFLLELRDHGDESTSITTLQLKGLFQDIIIGATDTTAAAVEWAMAELLNHPEMMARVHEELIQVVGLNNAVQEHHFQNLPYLQAVIKETLRLHPSLPLMVPHRPSQSAIVGGYTIPEGAQVFLNIWAIHTDPQIWNNPLEFRPERFLNNVDSGKVDYYGNNYQYLPFGSGRRICAGMPLAERMLLYILASFLHSFEWKLPDGVDLDLSDNFGIVMKKMDPLVAIPTPRLQDLDLPL